MIESFSDVINFSKNNIDISQILKEYVKYVRIILPNPVTCTAEIFLSSLRRLKSYLRSTMSQQRLNHVMLLNVNGNMTNNLNIDELCDKFIKRTSV